MNNKDMAELISKSYQGIEVNPKYKNEIEVITHNEESINGLLTTIKSMGFNHLCNITCVDWIKENRFDVTYNIWSYKEKLHLTLKVSVNRQTPELPTIMGIWPHAQVYERELHEMFGVIFAGNPNLKPMFLHNWHDIPPLRKDFDSEKYSNLAYHSQTNKQEETEQKQ